MRQVRLIQLPAPVRSRLQQHYASSLRDLNEVYLQLGRWPEAVFADTQTGRLSREPLAQVQNGADPKAAWEACGEPGTVGNIRKHVREAKKREDAERAVADDGAFLRSPLAAPRGERV